MARLLRAHAFERMLHARKAAVGAVLLATAVLAAFATRVRVDYSIEMAFPRFDQSRLDYERYRRDFPLDDAVAMVVVEAGDVFTRPGLERIAALERDLAALEGVVDTWGLTTAKDVVADGEGIRTDLLAPHGDPGGAALDGAALEKLRRTATGDPLFTWTLAPPDGRATTVQVTLAQEHASSEATRTAFLHRVREVVARHEAAAARAGVEQRITLSGLPVIRSEFTELINRDLGRLFPTALLVILVLLYASFRSLPDVGAALLTILFAVVWTLGVMGAAGLPFQVLSQVIPIVVMIISISDTSHIVTQFREELARGKPVTQAVAEACGDSAVPCLLTEITIAAGFLGLSFNDMVLIQQFGLATAVGVLLAWVANVTVLPLSLSLLGGARVRDRALGPTPVSRAFDRFVAVVERIIVNRPRAVWSVAAGIVVLAAAVGARVGREYYSYDDLRPEGATFQSLRRVERIAGGTVPFAVFVEPASAARVPDAMLEPEALALVDRIATRLEADFPEDVRNAGSVAKYLAKAHRLLVGESAAPARLPATRRLAAQELAAIDDPRALRNLLSTDRATAAVYGMVPDRGSSRASVMIRRLREYFAREEAAHPYRITLTGVFGIADGVYRTMVGGLVRSLGFAVLVSFLTFGLVLRSVRLAVVALVPNLLPLLLTLAVMGLLRIDLKPTTVIIFSITLVIADDDTIQYLSRFRDRFASLVRAGHPDPHREAALRTLRETAPPMFLTATVVSAGFASLLFSEFLGLANLGLLIGVSLLTAVFADLFLTPLMLMALRPKLSVSPREPSS